MDKIGMQALLNSYEEGKNLTLLETYIKKCGGSIESFVEKKKLCTVIKEKCCTLVVYVEKLLRAWITGQDMKCTTVDVYNKMKNL